MIANAADAKSRVVTLLYLLRDRYELEPAMAGGKLHRDYSGVDGFRQLLNEVRAALQTPEPLTSGTWCSDAEAREYLSAMVDAYDASVRSC